MKKLLELLMLAIMLIVTSCSDGKEEVDPNPTPSTPVITIPTAENTAPVIGQEGGIVTISFTASEAWTASITNSRADGWLSVDPTSGGKGDAKIAITAAANDAPDDRNATINLKCRTATKTIILTQKQKNALTVTTAKYEVESIGGTINVEVKANIAFEVEVSNDWITKIESRGLTTTNLNFAVAANKSGEQRVGEIIIKSGSLSETIKVYQDFSDFITLTQKEFMLSDAGGIIDVEIKSTIDYGVKFLPEVDWITEKSNRAVSTHTHHYLVRRNESYDAREAKIIFFNKENESLADTVSVYQAYKGALIVAHNDYEFDAEGGILELKLQSNLEFDVTSSVDWLRQIKSRGLEEFDLRFIIDANVEKESRTGVITIQARDGKNIQAIEVKQNGAIDYEAVERAALIALYQAAGGENWVKNTNWCSSDKPLKEWYGIRTENGRVVEISLGNNGLVGIIPSEIGELKSLRSLFLNDNSLSGGIPIEMFSLTDLVYLVLSRNQLSQSLPSELGNLLNLEALDLAGNQLSGSIPPEIGKLKKLHTVFLYDNALSGEIPNEIGNLTQLSILYLNNNQLTGTLPSSMAQLEKLETLSLTNNKLSGEIDETLTETRLWQKVWDIDDILAQQNGYQLTFKMYTSSDYSQDGAIQVLQKHTKGKGIKLVIMGDGYSDRLISDGTYLAAMSKAMEDFFITEPFHTYRDYFDVYSVTAVSKNEYVGYETALGTSFRDGEFVEPNPVFCIDYITKISELNNNLEVVTSIVVLNSKASFRSVCQIYTDGFSIAYCMGGETTTLHHEANGHGFGRLGDEYVEFNGYIPDSEKEYLLHLQQYGLYRNIDLSANTSEVRWSYFLTDMRYTNENIGIYEGAYRYTYGVYRSTENSIMRNNAGGFNTPSRLLIYKRIMELSGEEYSFEKFLEYDVVNRNQFTSGPRSIGPVEDLSKITSPPIIIDSSSSTIR